MGNRGMNVGVHYLGGLGPVRMKEFVLSLSQCILGCDVPREVY